MENAEDSKHDRPANIRASKKINLTEEWNMWFDLDKT